MNASTIIMPCNNTGFTDPKTTLGWGIVDFDWSNSKGTGNADGWAKHSPMDDEEMLFKQVCNTINTLLLVQCNQYLALGAMQSIPCSWCNAAAAIPLSP